MRKRGVCCRPVSVCLSVTLVDCIQTAEDIFKLLSRLSSPIILVFLTPGAGTRFQGDPFSGGAKYTGWENCAIFDWNGRLSRKRYEIGPWLLWNVSRKVIGALSNGDMFNGVDGPLILTGIWRSRYFSTLNIWETATAYSCSCSTATDGAAVTIGHQ